jgi:inhibitor of cysteine peptidase
MTGLFKFTSIIVLFLMLSACAANASVQADPVHLALQDANKTVTLKPGDSLEIELEGNPSTGYIWESATQVLKTLKQSGETEFLPAKVNLPGAPQMMVLYFTAVNPGQETLQLVYHRSWEKDTPPAKTFEVTIVVK